MSNHKPKRKHRRITWKEFPVTATEPITEFIRHGSKEEKTFWADPCWTAPIKSATI